MTGKGKQENRKQIKGNKGSRQQNKELYLNKLCILESFNTNISHQLFDYKLIFMNSPHKNTNSKGDFIFKKNGLKLSLKDLWFIKKSEIP